jgi:hypothetical protein
MLSSFGVRAYPIFTESFLARAFQNSISLLYNGLGQRTLPLRRGMKHVAGFGSGMDARPDKVCGCRQGLVSVIVELFRVLVLI